VYICPVPHVKGNMIFSVNTDDLLARQLASMGFKGNTAKAGLDDSESFLLVLHVERRITYFEKPGVANTAVCLEVVRQAFSDHGYKHLVIASTRGETGELFSSALRDDDVNLVVVTHSQGFKEPNTSEMPVETRRRIEQNGAKVYTGSMLTHSIETAFTSKFSGLYPTIIVAQSLRRFGEGSKVCCEIVMMAADAGLIPEGEEVLAVAGTGYGSDTVLVLKAAASKRFFDLKVLEILAKPRA
ncbi:MAG TPA: pyruvate kinase alpha/beta domain-containing protein, partial [Thermodesulfovibrionales bacterium]|nr:pyruvate kinase alpha/beta domain-containing protein [Thermodesulfovibrionales bacterium]